MEFTINLKIAFIGMENTFPIIQKTIIHAIIVNITDMSKFYHHSFIISYYDRIWTNITYPT